MKAQEKSKKQLIGELEQLRERITGLEEVVAELKQTEAWLKRRNEELASLGAIAAVVGKSLDLNEVLEAALDETMALLKVEGGVIYLYEETSQTFAPAVHRGFSQDVLREVTGFKLGEGLSGLAAASGQATVLDDIGAEPKNISPTSIREGWHSLAAVPIKSKEKVLGVITLASRRRGYLRDDIVGLLNHIGSQIGVSIENARLYDETKSVKESLQRSEEFSRTLLDNLADRIFAKDVAGRYTLMNKASYDFWSIPHGTALGKTDFELHDEITAKAFIESDRIVIETGKPYSVEERVRARDGRKLVLSVTKAPMRDELGNITGVVGISRDITKRKRLEDALEGMRSKLLNLQENERSSIARALHDSIGQNISLIDFNLTTIEEILDKESCERISGLSGNMRRVIRETAEKLRDIASGLHPREVQELGLVASISSLIESFQRRTKLQVSSTIQAKGLQIDESIAINLYRIVQEVLTNILKHSNCQSVVFQMKSVDGRILLQVKDDGIGFNPDQVMMRELDRRGMGLFIIQERARAIRGKLQIRSEPDEGTEVELEVELGECGKF